MKPANVDPLQQRFSDLQDRCRVQSTFVQFLEGIFQVFGSNSDESVDLTDPAPYRRQLQSVSDLLSNPSTPSLRSRLDEIETLLDENGTALLREDSKVPPSLQRQFFSRVASYDQGTVECLIAFYLRERGKQAWTADALDRVDFLSTRLVKDTADPDGAPDWHRVQTLYRSLAQVRARRWGPGEPASQQDRRLVPEFQNSAAAAQETGDITEVIDQFRRFKHGLGHQALEPDIWPEILRANWQVKTAVKQVLKREERHVLADVERVFEIESRVLPAPELVSELAGLRHMIASFEESVQSDNIRLEDLGDLKKRLRTTLHRLEAADVATEAGVAQVGDDQHQGSIQREELHQMAALLLEGTIFADEFQLLLAALAEADAGGDPEIVSQHSAVLSFEVTVPEVEAFRLLQSHESSPATHYRLLLEGAVVRHQLYSRTRELRLSSGGNLDRQVLIDGARTILAAAGRFLKLLEPEIAALRATGDEDAADGLERSRGEVEKRRSDLWLLAQVGVR